MKLNFRSEKFERNAIASLVMAMERILQHFRLNQVCEMNGMRSLFIEEVARRM